MNEFEPGDRVVDLIWDGRYTGTVTKVDGSSVFVHWDGGFTEDEMGAHQIAHLPQPEVAR